MLFREIRQENRIQNTMESFQEKNELNDPRDSKLKQSKTKAEFEMTRY